MFRLPRLLAASFAIATQRQLAHRANLLVEASMAAIGTGAGVASLGIVFAQVQTLAGWRLTEALVLLGLYQVVSGLLATFVEPNLVWFAGKVTGGALDDLLLQPVPSLYLASLGTCAPWSLAPAATGLVVLAAGLAGLGAALTPGRLVAGVLLLLVGLVLGWAARVLMASLAFWAPGFDPSLLYNALWQLGRYPVGIYHPLARRLLTWVVPVAFIATFPAQALARGVPSALLAGGLAAAAGAVLAAILAWRAGLRRYTSATS